MAIPSEPAARDLDLDVLGKSAMLNQLGADARAAFLDELDPIVVPRGTEIVREGDEGDYLYFILSGEARLRRNRLDLGLLKPGDHFGEIGFIGIRRRAASVEATTTMRLARLSRDGYQRMATRHPQLALHFLEAMVSHLGASLVAMTDNVGLLLHQRSLPRRTEVQVRRGGLVEAVRTGTPLRALLPTEVDGCLVVAALVDQKPVSLDAPIVSDATVAPLTIKEWEGRAIYRRSVGLLILEAAQRLGVKVRLGPSLGTAQVVYTERADGDLGERLSHAMQALAASDAPFREEHWSVEEAFSHFVDRGWTDAASLLRTRRDATVPLVSCGVVYALSPGPLLPSAGAIRDFQFLPHPDGLLLDLGETLRQYAAQSGIDEIAQEHAAPRFGSPMAREQERWLTALGVTSAGAFNARCISGQVSQVIRIAEGFHEKRIGSLADAIASRRGSIRIITIAGPSSSGKTTFIKRLSVQLEINGMHPVNISLDDYYVDLDKTVRDEIGEYDFEVLEALDTTLLQDHVVRLLAGEPVRTARYDFHTGKSAPAGGPEIRLEDGDVLMLEGIHGLNPRLLGESARREQIFAIFIHPSTTLPFDRLTSVAAEDVRLLRRIVRDRHHRNYHAADNILRWPSVRRGEHLHIFPFLPHADAVFDSSLVYELSVLKVFADRYLLEVPQGHPALPTAHRLRHLIDKFVTIYPDHVPPTSILREFIGGSGFEY